MMLNMQSLPAALWNYKDRRMNDLKKISSKLRTIMTISLLLTFLIILTGCSNANNELEKENGVEQVPEENNTEQNQTEVSPEKPVSTMTYNGEAYSNFIDNKKIQASALEVAKLEEFDSIYNRIYQQAVKTVVEEMIGQGTYTATSPLFILNPYGTNTTGLYMYFTAEEPVSVEYTVSVEDETIPDFTRIMYTNQAGEAVTEQEGMIIGLVPGMTNTLTLKTINTTGDIVSEAVYTLEVEDFGTVKETVLPSTEGAKTEELSNGLFVLFGYDRRNYAEEPRHLLFYDNYGVIRAEIPLDINRADFKIENMDGYLLFPCTDNHFAIMSPYGEIKAIYESNGYVFHHDFYYDKDINRLVVLANNVEKETKEDIVISLDLTTGKYTEVVDFETLLPKAKERAILPEGETKLDWLHLNTIELVNGTDIIVSSRELSSIIRVNDIYNNPYVKYIISEPSIWEGTGYEDLLYTQVGDFANTGGQHTVTYVEDENLSEGQYYLHMFNNNYGVSTTFPEYDWSVIEGIGLPGKEPEGSYYYKYLVDDNKGTYELVQSFLVPYSRIVASTQHYGDRIIVCSGVNGTYGEYDMEGNLIAEYHMDVDEFTYRVFKYNMNQHWFNETLSNVAGEKEIEKEFVQDLTGTEEEEEIDFDAFEDYSNAQSNIKGNDYSDIE